MPIGPYETFEECKADIKREYRERHPDWTEEHLDQVAGAVCGSLEKQTQGVRVVYQASFEPFLKEGRRFVKIYGIDDSVSKNDWGVTPAARARALQSLMAIPLLGPPSLSKDMIAVEDPELPHYGTWSVIGKPVDFESNSATYGVFEITVDKAWDMIQKHELSTTSPSVLVKEAHYDEDGKLIVDDFNWDHILFVDNPAFRNAGVVATCEGPNPTACNFGQTLQAAFLSHGQKPRQDVGTQSPPGTQSSREKTVSENKGEKSMSDEKSETTKQEKNQGCAEAAQAAADIKNAAEDMKTENEVLKTELKALQAWKAEVLERELNAKVDRVLELELNTGVIEEASKDEESKRLKALGMPTLQALISRLETVDRSMQAASIGHGPKTKFNAGKNLEGMAEQIRMEMFGHKNPPVNGEIKD